MTTDTHDMSVGQLAQLACVLEVCAPKVGNVHLHASFDDADWMDFVASATAIRPVMDAAPARGVGATVLDAVRATRDATGTNTNLGIILLLAPLCAAGRHDPLRDGLDRVLDSLDRSDTAAVYEAIRLAQPGGLGDSDQADVRGAAPELDLCSAMQLAADRDAIARQYATGFADVLDTIAPRLAELALDLPLDRAIVQAHIEQMAREPDSLIRRKCGEAVAVESARRAGEAARSAEPARHAELDVWHRDPDHRHNPGTSADLIAASLYVIMREGERWPARWARSVLP